jgi:hypothetical protein
MKILIKPGKSKNIITTNAIGGNYYESWMKWAYPTWKKYCERYDLGLVVFDTNMVDDAQKPYWQKLLIGNALKNNVPEVSNVCFMDTDILINPTAPNIFEAYDSDTIALVSQKKNLPYPLESVLRRIAFFRHTFCDSDYPLDSWLFASLKQIFEQHDLPCQKDVACTGLFIFNINNHSDMMRSWYNKYNCDVKILDGGTEEVHLNYEIQNFGKVTWLDYRYQALWIYEMAWKYPFLYHCGRHDKPFIKECIEASLFTNYFLHFAGAWEGDMWQIDGILDSDKSRNIFDKFSQYEKTPVTGNPKGVIKPKK